MNSSVSVQDKKLFLEWLVSRFDPGESEWLFEEIIQDERKLNTIHFVDYVENYPKGFWLKISDSSITQFLFFKGNLKTRDIYTAFHELQLYSDEDYFIQIDFPDKASNPLYRNVMETGASEMLEMKHAAEELLGEVLSKKQISLLEERINLAIDRNDRNAFHHYSTQLRKFKKML